jgi:pimeloyl-ACP methyl ester carboxylesterase
VLLLFGALYVLVCIGCATFQRRMIYFPPRVSPEAANETAQSDNLEPWRSNSGQPIGWKRLWPTQPAQGCALVLHGNACGAFQCAHYADLIQQAAAFDVFLLEYPGYAGRPGKPSEAALEQAAAEALEMLGTNLPVYCVGESLGTGVAAYLAGHFPDRIAGLVLLAPYTRLADVGQAHIRVFPVSWILSDKFPAEDFLRKFRGPVAVLLGGQDGVIPEKIGRRLYEDYAGPKRLWEFPEATHDALMFQSPEVWKQIFTFWGRHRIASLGE